MSSTIKFPVEFDITESRTADELLHFAQQIDNGKIHIGGMWGVEYGWVRSNFPDLEPLVVISLGEHINPHVQLMVHKDNASADFEQLRGKLLARFEKAPLIDVLFLETLRKKHGSDVFSFEDRNYRTVKSAILAVRKGRADCVIVNIETFTRIENALPGIASDLAVVLRSSPFPTPVLVGRSDRVQQLRRDLWTDVQRELVRSVDSAEGQQAISFWRIDSFGLPTEKYDKAVQTSMREYQIEDLPTPIQKNINKNG